MLDGEKILPFVRAFYGQPSTYLWEDDAGEVHIIPQGERGEQGHPLMPLLFCLGQHPALTAVSAGLEAGETLFAYLDDMYVVCSPGRVGAVHSPPEAAFRNLSQRRQDEGVEQEGSSPSCVSRVAASSGIVVSHSHRLERRFEPPDVPAGDQSAWRSRWASRFRSEDLGGQGRRTPNFVGEDTRSPRHTICVVVVVLLRCCASELLF